MELQDVVSHLSSGNKLDIKKLILAISKDENLKSIYESIKDTSN